jgi:hypothetical protein
VVAVTVLVVTEPTPEPTLADVLAVMNFVEANQNAQGTRQAELAGQVRSGFEAVARDMNLLREDIAGVKSDTAFVEGFNRDMHEALVRHIADPHAHPDAA